MTDFEAWWHLEGSTPPLPGEDGEEHCKRMCQIAWSNGAYKAREVLESLLDEAKLLADDRPVEIGHLPQWTLDAEHMLRRLVKAFNSASRPAKLESECNPQDLCAGCRCKYAAQPAQQEPVALGKPTDEMVQAATDEYDEWANENKGTTECIRAMLSKALKASPPAQRKPLTTQEIREWWASENGLEDCCMSKLDDFEKVVRAIEAAHGIKGDA